MKNYYCFKYKYVFLFYLYSSFLFIENMQVFKILLLLSFISLGSFCKKPDSYKEAALRSMRSDIDLLIIPKRYNLLDGSWMFEKTDAHFEKERLAKYLASYNRNLDDLKKAPSVNFRDSGSTITLSVNRTSHFSNYDYDRKIPLLFYGESWIKKGLYKEIVHQQHITPTLAKVLNVRNPNGVLAKPLTSIIKPNSKRPELVVVLVIDQGGQQYYLAHPDIPVNINKLKQDSAYFENAEVGHLDAHTAVGHAAIGTGAYPKESSVIANDKYVWKDKQMQATYIYEEADHSVSPAELLTETLADVVDEVNQNQSVVISQCYALRASIGMAGHGSYTTDPKKSPDKDFVYWLNSKTGDWETESKYYSLPSFAKEYNAYDRFVKEYGTSYRDATIKTIADLKPHWSTVMSTPAQVQLETELILKTIEETIIKENRHKDGNTDLVYVTLKATDAVGHNFGWESDEARETFAAVDTAVLQIREFLEKQFPDNFVLVLTADHGCAPLPELSGGKRFPVKEFFQQVNSLQGEGKHETSLINSMSIGQVSLNKELMAEKNIPISAVVAKILSIEVEGEKFFEAVYTQEELKKSSRLNLAE